MSTALELNVKPGDVLMETRGRTLGVYEVDRPSGYAVCALIKDGKWTGLPGTVGLNEDIFREKCGHDSQGLESYRKSIGV